MSTQLQLRRGNTAQHSSFTGANGEVTVNIDQYTLVVHDGTTAGGFAVAPKNNPIFTGNVNVGNVSISTDKISVGNSSVNTQIVAGNVFLNGSTLVVGNTATNVTINSSSISVGALTINSSAFSGDAATLGGNTASDLRTYADNKAANAYSNAISYSGNAAAAYTNAVSYVDGKSYVNTSQLSSNLGNYQTTAGLSSNVATLAANSATYVLANSGIVSNASGVFVNSAYIATITSNNSSYLNGNSASDLQTYSDNKAANAYSNAISYSGNAAQAYSNAITFASNATNVNTGTLAEARLPYRMNQNVRTSDTVEFAGMTLTGNLVVSGNVNIIGANNLSLTDNMIYLNSNSTTANPDLGISGNYNDGTYRHTGFFRDATDGKWKVFDNYEPEPDASVYIDTSNGTFHLADFQANQVFVGNTTVYATLNATSFNGTSNNSLYLGGNSASDLQTYADNKAANAYSNAIAYSGNSAAAYTNAVAYVDGKSFVNTSQLSSNLGNYQTTAGLSANVATLTSNNATNLGGVAAASYVQNTDSRTLSGNLTFTGFSTFTGNAVINALSANGGYGTAGQVLTSNGSTVYWSTASGGGFSNGQSISVNNFVVTGAFSANSSNGTNGQVLTTNGSAIYWSTISSPSIVAIREQYTGNGSNTLFTVTNGYTANSLSVFINGVLVRNGVDVDVTNGSTISFTVAPPNGALIDVIGSEQYTGVSPSFSDAIVANFLTGL